MNNELNALVDQALAGEQDAMRSLVDRFKRRVFGLCLHLLRHQQDAEDTTQETFVRALRSLGSWDRTRELSPWLLAIAGNCSRSLLARRLRRPQPMRLVDAVPDTHAEILEQRHLREEVDLALSQLRPEHRDAFLLFHEQQFSYAEIAAALGCPLGTVKTWVRRARQDLARQLVRRGVVEEVA